MRRSQETTIFTVQPRLRCLIRTPVIAALSVVVTSLFVAPTAFAQAKESEESILGPGCAPDRLATAHQAGGVAVETAEGENETLIPCLAPTGWRTAEVGMVVTNAASVFFH